ncbi:DUF84 family protein [Candidatus Saccharibacteria bacterium oral taxon 488]|nr:DUF84 family protein [Candidatus Saccharibacteria bacterium oral taxon 488]
MNITLCGSMKFIDKMDKVAAQLEARGHTVYKPDRAEGTAYDREQSHANAQLKRGYMNKRFDKIDLAGGIVVVNPPKNGIDGYIGGNSFLEMAYAFKHGLDIFTLYPLPKEIGYIDELCGMNPIVLDGDLEKVESHITGLPLVCIGAVSLVKRLAIERGFRRAGLPVRTEVVEVSPSGTELSMSLELTRQRAASCLSNLKKLGKTAADYVVDVESGLFRPFEDSIAYPCEVALVEGKDGVQRVGFSTGATLYDGDSSMAKQVNSTMLHRADQQLVEDAIYKAVAQARSDR